MSCIFWETSDWSLELPADVAVGVVLGGISLTVTVLPSAEEGVALDGGEPAEADSASEAGEPCPAVDAAASVAVGGSAAGEVPSAAGAVPSAEACSAARAASAAAWNAGLLGAA